MYDIKSSIIPRDRPQSLRFCGSCGGVAEGMPFSRISCFIVDLESARGAEDDVSRRIAGNSMLPIKSRTSSRRAVECFGARRDAASTVTVDHLGGANGETREANGVQWRDVEVIGSGAGAEGAIWRKTKGDRIIKRRFPRDVVISRSSS